MTAYYNEIEPYAAEWLRNLIKAGLVPDGEVDTRSIVDVQPADLAGFTQCHFFAGIGGWAHALRLAGWSDDRPIWTGSCPCQPFSVAGKGLGTDDPRHLWPHFFRLIRAARPPVVMGEQVAGAAGYGWFDGVAADLESENYASRAVDVPACAVNAPHIRSRLYWVASDVADARCEQAHKEQQRPKPHEGEWGSDSAGGCRVDHGQGHMADAVEVGRERWRSPSGQQAGADAGSQGGYRSDVADADKSRQLEPIDGSVSAAGMGASQSPGDSGFWSNAIWLAGADGKARRAEPTIPLLAHGVPARVGRLRAYGNAIVPQVAAEVIAAFMEANECQPQY